MRGKLDKIRCERIAQRITPAGAGKTRICPQTSAEGGDHPRRCGENLNPSVAMQPFLGSPPQVRGKQFFNRVALTVIRITPAGAGKTTA